PQELRVEPLDPLAVRGQRRTVVDDGPVGEKDVEDGWFSAHARGDAVLEHRGGEPVAQARARPVESRVRARLPELRQRGESRGARDRVAVEGPGLPDVLRRPLERRVAVAHGPSWPRDARER